jgi:hypothetical protein
MQAPFPDDFLLFDITYKKIIINLVNVGVRKGRIIKNLSLIDEFTKWTIIKDEIFLFHPRNGKLFSIKNQLFIKLWQILITCNNYNEFKDNVKENQLVDKESTNELLSKFSESINIYLKSFQRR